LLITPTGGAAVSRVPEGSDVITIENKISFFRPGLGPVLVCRAEVLHAGRNLVFAEAEVTNERKGGWQIVAKASSTLKVIPLNAKPD
jgi:acyl-coenzyme A thioesterase PaaI-like protein